MFSRYPEGTDLLLRGRDVEKQWVAQWRVVRALGTRKQGAYLRVALSFASESLCAFALFEVLGTRLVTKQLFPTQRLVAVVALSHRQ